MIKKDRVKGLYSSCEKAFRDCPKDKMLAEQLKVAIDLFHAFSTEKEKNSPKKDTRDSYNHIYVLDYASRNIYHGKISTVESVEDWLKDHNFSETNCEVLCTYEPIGLITEI